MIPFSCHLLPLHSSSPYLALRLTNSHSILYLSLKSSQCDPNLWATSTVISFLPVQIKYLDLQSHPRTPLSIISGPLTFGVGSTHPFISVTPSLRSYSAIRDVEPSSTPDFHTSTYLYFITSLPLFSHSTATLLTMVLYKVVSK